MLTVIFPYKKLGAGADNLSLIPESGDVVVASKSLNHFCVLPIH